MSLSVAALLGLAGCAIEETDSAERRISEDELYDLRLEGVSPLQTAFMQDCLKCIMGDYSKLDELTAKFTASQRDPNFPEPYVLQAYEPNILFEACAQKALHDGRPELFKATVTRAGRAARIAQHFYAAVTNPSSSYYHNIQTQLQARSQD